MKAVLIDRHGGNEVVRVGERPEPVAGPREAVVRLQAAAFNRLDVFVRNGIPGVPIDLPHVPGADGFGVVESVGADVTDLAPGAKVVLQPGLACGRCETCRKGERSLCVSYGLLGEHVPGTFAERIAVAREQLFPAPDLSPEENAAFGLAGLTAWRMLVTRAALRPGESVLVHGIGGGVSTFALQIARLAGASLVIVTSSSAEKLARARELGADVGIDYRREDVARRVREITGKRGVDVVVDSVGAATWRTSLLSAAKGGRIVTCGATTGPNPEEEIRHIFWKQLSILGSTMGTDAEFEAMRRSVAAGRLRPVVDSVFPLHEAAKGYERMESGAGFGKIVIRIAP